MDIKHLSIRNFLTIGQADLQLDNRGLLLIQGENDDDSSASSNGAGKSSIVDALCWCLYGETAREVTGDAVVNRHAKKDTSVMVTLSDGGVEYKIERYRKHAKFKNQLFAWQLAANPMDPSTDLSKGTDKETQQVVDKIMGCTLPVFVGAIYAGQEKMPDLPGMTDKHLKLLIEEAAGTEIMAEAYAEARRRSLTVDADYTAAATYAKSVESRLAAIKAELTDAETQHQLFEDGRKDRARTELARAKPLQDQLDGILASIAAIDETGLTAKQADLDKQLLARKAQDAELATLITADRAAATKVASLRATAEGHKRAHDSQVQALADIDSQVGKPCGECGKAYCEHDLETAKAARTEAIAKAKGALTDSVKALKAAMGEVEAAKKAVETFQASMTDVSAATAELAGIRTQLGQLATLRAEQASRERALGQVKDTAKLRLTEPNPWTKAVEGKKADVARCEAEVTATLAKVAELEDKAALYADAVKVFGPAGVRAHMLDTVTPFLNEKTGDYLGALADGNIHAVWSTLAKTAKGDLKEKFNIEVTNDKGGDSFKALSGGEKRKVRIATNLALQDMVATRAAKPINLWVGDEIDHALDEPGLERLMTVLDRKAKERGTVLVVSHNSLRDWIDNVIHVKKTGGVSTVSGATVHGF